MRKDCIHFYFPLSCTPLPLSLKVEGHRLFKDCVQEVSLKPLEMTCRNKIGFSYDLFIESRCYFLFLFTESGKKSMCFSHFVIVLSIYASVCVCGEGCERENRIVCRCKYSLRGQTSREKMNVFFICYILIIHDHNFLKFRVY